MNTAKLITLGLLRGSGAAAFSPLDIAGLVLWLDASDSTTLFQDDAGTTPATAADAVIGRWEDKSGNGFHATQGTLANKPLLKLAVQNGLNVVRFDGSNDVLSYAGATFAHPFTFVFASIPRTGATPYGAFIGGRSPTVAGAYFVPNGKEVGLYAGAGIFQNAVDYRNASVIVTAVFNTVASTLRINGATKASGNTGSNVFISYQIGNNSAGQYLIGDMLELVIFPQVLTAGEIAALEAYLNAKWVVY